VPFSTARKLSRRAFVVSSLGSALALRGSGVEGVAVLKTPDRGLQPQAVVDRKGVIHMVFLAGDPAASAVYYVRKSPRAEGFSPPIRVNSVRGAAIAVGTVRGAHLALGRSERVHVAWNGSSSAETKGPAGSAPLFYSRMNDAGVSFEPERNLMNVSSGLDGGGTIAADGEGNVYVTWHGQPTGVHTPEGEGSRRVWLAHSEDEGKTFGEEAAVSPRQTGVCGCCGMGALCDHEGNLYLMYRSAQNLVHRDMHLLASRDCGKTISASKLDSWEIGGCPMSTVSLTESRAGVFAAWENAKQIYFARLDPRTLAAGQPIAAPGDGSNRKHPSVAVNRNGEMVLAWTEGTGWKKGGVVVAQTLDRGGSPVGKPMNRIPIPAWGFAAAVAVGDRFLVVS